MTNLYCAYADPPYYGCGKRYYSDHPECGVWDIKQTHLDLISRLREEFPDGWALSCNSKDLHWLLPACPENSRIGAWVKPFASGYKPGIRIAYSWEPVIWTGGRRKHAKGEPVFRDSLIANATKMTGLIGAKPSTFNRWVVDLLGLDAGDRLIDLFPGTGGLNLAMNQGVLL